MNQPFPQARKGRKYDQVIEGARSVFMREGFEGASVDAIAKAAGVSKATLYSYFADKEILFLEVARGECLRQAERAEMEVGFEQSVQVTLRQIAEQMTAFFLSDFGLRVFRVCVAESDRFPELGREFYRSGPEMAHAKLVGYLKFAVDQGQLQIEDCELASYQFIELCKAHLFARRVFNIDEAPDQAARDHVIDGAVEMFMARYGVKSALATA